MLYILKHALMRSTLLTTTLFASLHASAVMSTGYYPITLACVDDNTTLEVSMRPKNNEAQLYYKSAATKEPVNVFVSAPATDTSFSSVNIITTASEDDGSNTIVMSAATSQTFELTSVGNFSVKLAQDFLGKITVKELTYETGILESPDTMRCGIELFPNLACTLNGL